MILLKISLSVLIIKIFQMSLVKGMLRYRKLKLSEQAWSFHVRKKVILDSYLLSPTKKSEFSGSIHVNFFTTSALFKLQFLG
jgi:hypothetical protein